MLITKTWAMPDRHTFRIFPIKELLKKYCAGKNWIDPFAGENSPAEITNDLNPGKPTKFHLHAYDFMEQLTEIYDGCLFDPPYSLRQVKECYNQIGIEIMSQKDSQSFPSYIKDLISIKIKEEGIVICFGWNSSGFGLRRGFKMEEILLVCHGGNHNDTIVTVEKKLKINQLKLEL